MDRGDVELLTLSLKDRYSDSGLVGVSILIFKDETSYIDTFLMSCRVIGRRVEEVLLQGVLKTAQRRRCQHIKANYCPTEKNHMVADFYTQHGFIEEKNKLFLKLFLTNLCNESSFVPNLL